MQTGLAGDAAGGGDTRADSPNFFAEIYDPEAQEGSRYTTLARSRIMRMYHSTAALTTEGTILVSGCDRCAKVSSPLDFDAPSVSSTFIGCLQFSAMGICYFACNTATSEMPLQVCNNSS